MRFSLQTDQIYPVSSLITGSLIVVGNGGSRCSVSAAAQQLALSSRPTVSKGCRREMSLGIIVVESQAICSDAHLQASH